jgi:hypothetical protein
MPSRRSTAAAALCVLIVAGCAEETATPSPTPTPSPTVTPTTTLAPSPTTPATPEPSPTPSPEPELTLAMPEEQDPRIIDYSVTVDLPPGESGRVVVTVTNRDESRVDEIVVRWPTELGERLFLAPSAGSFDVPLIVPWTKWVEGPGEQGEPAGTTSLGWGPLDAGATLEITMSAERRGEEPEPLAFDLQLLAGEAIMTGPDGEPAATRVEVP